jgi:hypothetical protein
VQPGKYLICIWISVHTLSKSSVIVAIWALNLPANSDNVVANGSTYTSFLLYHQKKKIFIEMESGERGDHVLGPLLPIHFSGNL